MKEIFPRQVAGLTARGLVIPHYVMESPPENMRLTLEYLYENYQGAVKYFKSIGLSDEENRKTEEKAYRIEERPCRKQMGNHCLAAGPFIPINEIVKAVNKNLV